MSGNPAAETARKAALAVGWTEADAHALRAFLSEQVGASVRALTPRDVVWRDSSGRSHRYLRDAGPGACCRLCAVDLRQLRLVRAFVGNA